MNRLILLLLAVLGSSALYAQEKSTTELKLSKTESNGIQVYEAPGNKNPGATPIQTPAERTINDWNLEECENALYYLDLKIEKSKEYEGEPEVEQRKHYEIQRQAILARIQVLSNTTK